MGIFDFLKRKKTSSEWRVLATEKEDMRCYEDAIADYTRALEEESNQGWVSGATREAYSGRARCKDCLKDYSGAILDITKAIEIAPNYLMGYYQRACYKYSLQDYSGVIEDNIMTLELLKICEGNSHDFIVDRLDVPNNIKQLIYLNNGLARNGLMEFALAIHNFTEAIKLDSDFADAYQNRAALNFHLKNFNDALKDAERAFELGNSAAKQIIDKALEEGAVNSSEGLNETFKKPQKKTTQEKSHILLYHDNGQLKTEATLDSNGDSHGNCKEWYPNKKIFKDQNYKHGVPHGTIKEYFDNGNIKLEHNYKNGQHHGINNEFYEDGSKNIIATYKDGKEHGIYEQYYPSGNLEVRTTFVDGMMEGVHIYLNEDGDVIEEKIMQKGLDITIELMQLMTENDSEHLLKSGCFKDGAQATNAGQISQELYKYYISHDLRVESVQVSSLNSLYKKGEITKEFYNMSMSALGQN